MSPPAVEIGSPVETIPSFLNSAENFSAFFPETTHSHDQRNMDLPSSPSSSYTASGIRNGINFEFEAGSGEKTKSRPKPRLVKLRKNGRKVKGTSFSGEIPSGFNPFAPPTNGNACYISAF